MGCTIGSVTTQRPYKKSRFTPRYERFLKLLKEARTKAGLSQTQAAKRLKRVQTYVSKSELGERRVDVVEFLEFCKVYEVTPEEFIRKL